MKRIYGPLLILAIPTLAMLQPWAEAAGDEFGFSDMTPELRRKRPARTLPSEMFRYGRDAILPSADPREAAALLEDGLRAVVRQHCTSVVETALRDVIMLHATNTFNRQTIEALIPGGTSGDIACAFLIRYLGSDAQVRFRPEDAQIYRAELIALDLRRRAACPEN